MTKEEFLIRLKKKLSAIPKDEADEAIKYYEEYLSEAENIEEAIKDLGTPENVSAKIIATYIDKSNSAGKNNLNLLWLCILAILSAPLTIPLVCILFALVITGLSLMFASACVAFSGLAVSIDFLWTGFIALFKYFPSGIFYIGLSFLVFSVSLALIKILIFICGNLIRFISKRLTKKILKGATK